jgi:predicted DCC family thiol-disulfide oxidoreductase YuxK
MNSSRGSTRKRPKTREFRVARVCQVSEPPGRPTLVYDGDCGFCRRTVARLKSWTGEEVEYLAFQDALESGRFTEIPRAQFEESVQFIDQEGRVSSGAEAAARSLRGVARWPLWIYQRAPGAAWVSEGVYRWVARNRGVLSRVVTALWGEPPRRV